MCESEPDILAVNTSMYHDYPAERYASASFRAEFLGLRRDDMVLTLPGITPPIDNDLLCVKGEDDTTRLMLHRPYGVGATCAYADWRDGTDCLH